MWILIVASVCFSTTTTTGVAATSIQAFTLAPPAPTIESRTFPTREALDAFVLQRIVWGPCSETLAAVSPDGKVYRVAKTERTKRVVREVEEHDGFVVTWSLASGAAEGEK